MSAVILIIFGISSYIFFIHNQTLINDIREQNIANSMKTFQLREQNNIDTHKKEMLNALNIIAEYSSDYLQTFDMKSLKKILLSYIKKRNIELIKIWDDDLDKLFLLAFKKDGKIIFANNMPDMPDKFIKLEGHIHLLSDDSHIGSVTLYYDDSLILDSINTLKNKTLADLDKSNLEINEKLDNASKHIFFIYFIGLLAILISITILLKELVNNPLRKLKAGLNNFFLFLQNKKETIKDIEISSHDEFGQMALSLNENIKISVHIHETINRLNAVLKLKTIKERTLLDNANQGFLTFNKDFIIDNEYSKECEIFFGNKIANNNISTILFPNTEDANKFKSVLLDALDINNEIVQKSMLSLLPNEIVLNRRALRLEYKIVKGDTTMLIVTNISKEKVLESKIKKEQSILKMLIPVIEDSDTFHEIKKDFKYFAENKIKYVDTLEAPFLNIDKLYRVIHTFKGLFLQFFMDDTSKKLHEVESQLSKFLTNSDNLTNEDISKYLNETNFDTFIDNDNDMISHLLGDKFMDNHNLISVDKQKLENLEAKCTLLLESSLKDDKLSESLLSDIRALTHKSLKSQLDKYPKFVLRLAQELNKEVYEFDIIGDENTVMPENFQPFINSLVHLFRNSIDHGIETREKRMELEKNEIGTISCTFNNDNNILQIICSDDGAGINIENIKKKIFKEVDISTLSDEDIYQYIFKNNMSTKDEITSIAGRGIGMSVIKQEVENINGTIEIKSELNVGTTFIFNFPIVA